jgi:NADPH:quinone reductase-like Zn-dependent oxidoreductase
VPSPRRGTLVIVGSEGRGRWLGGFDRNLRAVALARLVGQRLRMLGSTPRPQDLQTLWELSEAGKVTPVIGRTYPLGGVPEAIRYLVEGHGGSGKVVITA